MSDLKKTAEEEGEEDMVEEVVASVEEGIQAGVEEVTVEVEDGEEVVETVEVAEAVEVVEEAMVVAAVAVVVDKNALLTDTYRDAIRFKCPSCVFDKSF